MSFSLTVSFSTLVAVVLTVLIWVWCFGAIARDERRNGGGFFPAIGGLFFLPVAAVGTLAVWLARACVALWWQA